MMWRKPAWLEGKGDEKRASKHQQQETGTLSVCGGGGGNGPVVKDVAQVSMA